MLPAHFSLTVISVTCTEYTAHTHSHRHGHTQGHRQLFLTALQLNPWSVLPEVSWCDWLPHSPEDGAYPRAFFPPITHTSVPLQLNMHTTKFLLLILTFLLLNGLFLVLFHSMACAFFLLFLRIWTMMPHFKKTKKKKKKTTTKNVSKLWRVEVFLGVIIWSTTLIRDVEVRNTAGGSSRHPTSSWYSTVCDVNRKTANSKNVLFLVLCVSPTWLVKKQLAFYISVLSIWNLFLYQYLIIGLILF